TTVMPPWLAAVGSGASRRAVIIPEKVAVVQRIYDMAVAGRGVSRILRTLLADGTPPLTRQAVWCRATLGRILTDRAVLGEYQPCGGGGKNRRRGGPPVPDFYPAIITEATFHKARSVMGSRKPLDGNGKVGRDSKLLNVFSGLLKDARFR